MRSAGQEIVRQRAIIPMASILKGAPVHEILAAAHGRGARERWALRREYRSTYRDTIVPTETLLTGKWFGADTAAKGAGRAAADTLSNSPSSGKSPRNFRWCLVTR